MPVYYPGPCVRVTDRAFEVQSPPQAYEIRDLRHVVAVQRETPIDTCATTIRACLAGITAIAATTAMIDWPRLDEVMIVTAVVASVIVVSTMVVCGMPRPRRRMQELWAVYRGRPVCLFKTTDELVFGQVRRALLRAIEQNGQRW